AENERLIYERDVWRSKSNMHQKAAVGLTIAEARLAEAVRLLVRLGTWIEDEVNAELPFITEAEDDAYRTFLQSLEKRSEMKLTVEEQEFLKRIAALQHPGLADRKADRVRQRMRHAGLATYNRSVA